MPVMSAEELKAAARRYVDELYNKGHTAVVYEYLAPNFVYHTARLPFTPDREGVIQEMTMLRTAFPDLRFTVDDQLIEGDKGVMRWTLRGTHKGDYFDIPPTHKQVAWSGIVFARMSDGKYTEWWNFPESLGLFQQVGAYPQAAIVRQPQAPHAEVQA